MAKVAGGLTLHPYVVTAQLPGKPWRITMPCMARSPEQAARHFSELMASCQIPDEYIKVHVGNRVEYVVPQERVRELEREQALAEPPRAGEEAGG